MICPFSLLLINPLYFFCYYLFIYYNIIYFLIPIVKQQCQWLYHSVIYMMILLFNHHSQTKNKLFYYIICQRFIWYNNLYSVLRVILSQSLLKLFWKLFIFCQHVCVARCQRIGAGSTPTPRAMMAPLQSRASMVHGHGTCMLAQLRASMHEATHNSLWP